MDDAASRFWGGRRLSTLTADDMERYLKEKGRSEKLADWQFM